MNNSELIKNYEKYITEVSNKIDILSREVSSLYDKIDKLSESNSVKKSNLLYHNPITEEELILNINNGIFDPELEGKEVTLKEDKNGTHNWIIVRVNSNSYDLWYNGSIGIARWKGSDTGRYWFNNSPTDASNPRELCNFYKSRLSSSIKDKLKPGLNVNCSDDTVVILSAKQLGYTNIKALNDDNVPIPYFNSDSRRAIGHYCWTSTADSICSYYLWFVLNDGSFDYSYYDCNYAVVPAIRIGM